MKTLESLKLNGQLPSPKGVALAILEICRRDDATTAEIAKVVQTDPALSGRLIRQANSVANGGRSVASVPEAILRVGLGAVGGGVRRQLVSRRRCRGYRLDRHGAGHSSVVGAGATRGTALVGPPVGSVGRVGDGALGA